MESINYEDIRPKLTKETEVRDVLWNALQYISTADSGYIKIKNSDSYPIEPDFEKELFKTLSVPPKYLERCPNKLKEENVNYWLQRKEDDVRVVLEEGKLKGTLPTRATYVPSVEIFDTVMDTLKDIDQKTKICRFQQRGSIDMAEIVLPDTKKNYGGGDGGTYYGGTSILYSDLLTVNPHVDTYWWREICSNGMRATESHYRFRFVGKTQDQILDGVRTAISNSLEYISLIADQLKKLRNSKVDNIEEALSRIFREYGLPSRLRQVVVDAMQLEHGNNQEAIMNALTRAANMVEDENDRLNLQTAGGLLMQNNQHRCPQCFNRLLVNA